MNVSNPIAAEVQQIFKLYSEGKFEIGLQRSLGLLKAAPNLAISNYCAGHAYGGLGASLNAEKFLRKATQIEPRNVDYLIRFGKVLLDSGRIHMAQSVLKKAQELDPKLPIVPLTLGIFYSSIGRFDAAEDFFRQVIDGEFPEPVKNGAKLSWAKALSEIGRIDDAKSVLRQLLEVPDQRERALVELSDIAAFPVTSNEFAALEAASRRTDILGRDRSMLFFAMAQSYASGNEHEMELEALKTSKLLRGASDNSEKFGAAVDEMISIFSEDAIAEIRHLSANDHFAPIHVVGLPRSGTTLTERILSSHSRVGGAGELHLISNFMNDVLEGRPAAEFVKKLRSMNREIIAERVIGIEKTMKFLRSDKERIVDKMPHNFFRCGLIAALFPRGSIVHCFRSPADNFLSGFKANLNDNHSYFHRPEWFIPYHHHYVRLMEHWKRVVPGRIFALNYEELVTSPNATIGQLLEFCNLGWEEKCLYPETESSRIATASIYQARKPINSKSVGGWKKYASYLQVIEDGCSVATLK